MTAPSNDTPLKPAVVSKIEPRVVPVPEARKLLGKCGKTRFYKLVALGKVRVVKLGGSTLVDVASINALLDEVGVTK
jgi:hypothetical protein